MESKNRRTRWYHKPGGVPLPETAKGAADGARYTCLEGDDSWEEIDSWKPPTEKVSARPRKKVERGLIDV